MWAFANGVAMANPGKAVVLLGSDGSQMEGDNAEAARLCVGKSSNVKVLIDDNNVTIAGHPTVHAWLRPRANARRPRPDGRRRRRAKTSTRSTRACAARCG